MDGWEGLCLCVCLCVRSGFLRLHMSLFLYLYGMFVFHSACLSSICTCWHLCSSLLCVYVCIFFAGVCKFLYLSL